MMRLAQPPIPRPRASAPHPGYPWRAIPALLAVVVLLLVGTPGASAHAQLTASAPASGSALPEAPDLIQMTFSEGIDPMTARADLLDASGVTVQSASLVVTASGFDASFPITDADRLPNGNYALVWRVISAVDGHESIGTIAFSVGTGQAPAGWSTGGDDAPPVWRVLIRWLHLAGWIVLFGGFLLITHSGQLVPTGETRERTWSRWGVALAVGLGMAIVGVLLAFQDQATRSSGSGFFSVPDGSVVRSLLTESSFGQWWLLEIAAVGVALFAVTWLDARLDRRVAAVGTLAGLLAMVAIAAGGHAAGVDPQWAAVLTDAIHLAGAGTWFGGLVFLLLALPVLRSSPEPAALGRIAARFSSSALVAVGLIAVSGIITASFHVAGPRALRSQFYGIVLIVKQAIVLPIVVIGAVNLLVIRPMIGRAAVSGRPAAMTRATGRLRAALLVELVAGVGIIAAGAVLGLSAPATRPEPVLVASRPTTIDQRGQAGDVGVWLLANLTGSATDRYAVTLTDADGAPLVDVQRVIVDTSLVSVDPSIGERFDATQLDGGAGNRWVFPASQLGLEGTWQLDLIIRRGGVEDVTTSFTVDTAGLAPAPPRLVIEEWRWPRFDWRSWAALVAGIVMVALGVIGLRRLKGLDPIAAGVLFGMMLLIALGFFATTWRQAIPVTAGTGLVNPVGADDPGALTRGGDLYLSSCALCHGASGQGTSNDDPVHSHGDAADLTSRRVTEQTDGDLFTTTSAGIGGTEMPAFDAALTETERWEIITYIRQLQAQDGAPGD